MPLWSVLDYVEEYAPRFRAWADDIWDHPELSLQERHSSALLADALESFGFEVERGAAGMSTAFVAAFGTGRPCVGLLAEFDALPGLSQERGAAEPLPLVPGGPGHGCGHNLLGVASTAAALAVKHAIERGDVRGSVRLFGCPAEETLTGKVFMVKAGLFADVGCVLTWHPGMVHAVSASASLAANSARFTFHGVPAHASAAPERGRSALDAVELMNVGANYLREHLPASVRLHYVITDGGQGPNVVPGRAQVWYYVRAPRRVEVESAYGRLLDVARGACLMTGTTHAAELLAGCYDTLPNRVLGDLLQANMESIGAPLFGAEEFALARRLRGSLGEEALREPLRHDGRDLTALLGAGAELCEAILPHQAAGAVGGASTDVGDVSHVVPLGSFTAATTALGVPGHSWQNVVTAGSAIGQRGMLFAAQVLAATACDLLDRPERVAAAWDEFAEATADEPYLSPVRDLNAPSPGA